MCERYNEPWFIKCFQRYIKFWKLFNIETLRPSCADFTAKYFIFIYVCCIGFKLRLYLAGFIHDLFSMISFRGAIALILNCFQA